MVFPPTGISLNSKIFYVRKSSKFSNPPKLIELIPVDNQTLCKSNFCKILENMIKISSRKFKVLRLENCKWQITNTTLYVSNISRARSYVFANK